MKKLNVLTRMLLLVALLVGGTSVWADVTPTVLFHETFGDNSNSARTWKDGYSVKSGTPDVYSGLYSYTLTNAKQSKNTTGYGTGSKPGSGLNGTTEKDATIEIGPLDVSQYDQLKLKYQWKAASINATYYTSAAYRVGTTGDYTTIKTYGNKSGADELKGATTYVEVDYNIPGSACVSNLYLKITYQTSNTNALIDEIDLSYNGTPIAPKMLDKYVWDFTSAASQTAAGTVTANSTNTLTATDGTSTIKYVAGSSCTYDADLGYLKPGGGTSVSNKRYFVLHIDSDGELTLASSGTNGTYSIYQGDTEDFAAAYADGAKTTIKTTGNDTPVSGAINLSDGEYVFIGYANKIYTRKIVWTPNNVTLTTTDNMDGWRAFYDATQGYTLDANTKAYIASETTASTVKLKEIADVPAGTPVILHTSSSADNHKMTLTKAASTSGVATGNLLAVTNGNDDVASKYRLGYLAGDGNGIGFYPYSATKPAAGIVYLDVPSGDAKGLTFVFDDDETDGIKAVSTNVENGVRYNLAGQKVGADYKGIVIVNGKKYLNK